METFVDMVRHGGGAQFNPLFEEKGGWIVWEGPKCVTRMMDALMEPTHLGRHQPLQGSSGWEPYIHCRSNFSGFFVRKDHVLFKLNTEKLLACIVTLKDELVIAKFAVPKPSPQALQSWIQTLNRELRGITLTLCKNVGKTYFLISANDNNIIRHALMLSPCKEQWGTCML
jgi:hypothetical protein